MGWAVLIALAGAVLIFFLGAAAHAWSDRRRR